MSQPKKSLLELDLRVTVGNILSMMTVIISIFCAYNGLKTDYDQLKATVAILQNDISWVKNELQDRKNSPTRTASRDP